MTDEQPGQGPDEGVADFGDTVRTRRNALEMTQDQVAEQVGVKPHYIGYLERGMRKPSDEICVRIADVLGLDRQEVFFLANPHLREILSPPTAPERTSWEIFSSDRQLHKRQRITDAEIEVLEGIGRLGDVVDVRDYLFILRVIRQAIARG